MKYTIEREPYTLDIYRLQKLCLPSDAPVPEKDKQLYWVARTEDGDAVAFVILYEHGEYWYLSRAGTAPAHIGRGLYKRLLKASFRHIKKSGVTQIYTDCTYWNTSSANGLMAVGFRMYTPTQKWAFRDGLYWTLKL